MSIRKLRTATSKDLPVDIDSTRMTDEIRPGVPFHLQIEEEGNTQDRQQAEQLIKEIRQRMQFENAQQLQKQTDD